MSSYTKEIFLSVSLLTVHFCSTFGAQTPLLSISDGQLEGQVNTTIRKNVTYYNFRGIPYAQPPVGNLRFADPVKNDRWHGTRDATYDRSECIQFASDDNVGTTVYGDEDCLFINVYTPDLNATDLPVLVWIHGGTFIHGNGSYKSFGPDFFLEQGLVFVSFNYRLGIFGFLSTEDDVCPGNAGIKDQILALKWVQKNIAKFGGDPGNVTIFGESAGSVSVSLLLQTQQTAGLFSKAIMNSGTTLNLWALNTRPLEVAQTVAGLAGIIFANSTEIVQGLRKLDADTLQHKSWLFPEVSIYSRNALKGLIYAPSMEPNVTGAVYVNPSDGALRNGTFNRVKVLMGFNSNEAAAVGSIPVALRPYLGLYDLSPELLTPWSMTQNFASRVQAGAEIKKHYFGSLLSLISLSSNKLIHFISTDQFTRPIRRAAADMANYTTVYFYEFGYQGKIAGVGTREFPGTGHAEDLQYLFRSYNNFTATDLAVSATTVLLWSNFAKFGNPTPEYDPALNKTIWPAVDPKSADFHYLSINESIAVSKNPKQDDWEFYQEEWKKYGTDVLQTTY